MNLKQWGDIPDWAYASVRALMESLKEVDPETYFHSLRVGEMCKKLSRDAGFNEYQQKLAEFSGILHDVGKMTLQQNILHKPAKLTTEEMVHVQTHAEASERLVAPLAHHEMFKQILPAIRSHHERIDGNGYPDKLGGETIPILSRIILIVDTVDAMGTSRSYRKGLPQDVIIAELLKYANTQFDSQLVNIYLDSHRFWKNENTNTESVQEIIKKVA